MGAIPGATRHCRCNYGHSTILQSDIFRPKATTPNFVKRDFDSRPTTHRVICVGTVGTRAWRREMVSKFDPLGEERTEIDLLE